MNFPKWLLPICTLMLMLVLGAGFGSGFAAQTPEAQGPDAEGLSVLASSQEGVSFRLDVPADALVLEMVQAQGADFVNLALPGWQPMNQAGAPALPYRVFSVGVPFGAQISLEVEPGAARTIALSAPLIPALSQALVEGAASLPEEGGLPHVETLVEADPQFYASPDAFPGDLARISNEGVLRGQRIAAVAVYPIQYQPLENTLTVYEYLSVQVRFVGAESLAGAVSGAQDARVYEDLLADTLLNYPEARSWRQPSGTAADLASASPTWAPPANAWKLVVREEGFYQVSGASLQAAGFPVNTPTPANIRMFNQGHEVALGLQLGVDNAVESIIFYGQALESKYTADNVYWLYAGTQPGLRITQRSGAPAGAAVPAHYQRSETFEQNSLYIGNSPGPDDLERYYWTYLFPPSKPSLTHTFTLGHAPASGSGTLSVDLFGQTSYNQYNPDHHVAFYLNEVFLGDVWFDGRIWPTVMLDVPAGLLQAGSNTLRVTCPNDTDAGYEIVFIDRMTLEFPDAFTAQDETLHFAYETPGTWQFQVGGFTSSTAVDIYDISSSLQPTAITGASFASSTLTFQDTLTGPKTYQALGTGAYLAPDSIAKDTSSSLRSGSNNAELILVSHSDFLDAANTLASYRSGLGTSTIVADVQDVYDEFGNGIVSPYAIRDFLAYTQTNWAAPAPAYVLLIGDGHYDPKNYEGFGRTSYIPPFLVMADALAGETAADNRYVTFDGEGDLLADMTIGRFSVNTLDEANAMVAKIMAYEALEPGDAAWQREVLFVADDVPVFANAADFLADYYVSPNEFAVSKVYQGIAPHETLAAARTAIQTNINNGTLFVDYIGHGYIPQWGDDGLLKVQDIALLTNSGKPPIVLGMTCREGSFHTPNPLATNNEALAEVFTRKAVGGALASWSASGTAVLTGHFSLNAGFYEAYFNDGVGTLGGATAAGKLALWSTGYALDLLDTFHLFGDPSIVFKRGLTAVSDDYPMDESGTLTVSAPGVLANDINPDGLTLTAQYIVDSGPTYGTLGFNTDGSFTYTPTPGWYGLDRFSYRAVSGSTQSNPTIVNLIVRSTNQAPIGTPDSYTTDEDTPLIVTAQGVLVNDLDADGDALTASVYQKPTRGSFTLQADGSFSYYPYSNVNGTDSFTYRVYDGEDYSAITTVTINLTPVNDAPRAFPDFYNVDMGSTLNVPAPGVLADDFDTDSASISAVLEPGSGPLNGSLTFNADGSFSYTPDFGYAGEDTFSYRASDGDLASDPALVTITVLEAYLPPVAADDSYSVAEDQSLTVEAPGVLSNDTDANSEDILTAILVSGTVHGELMLTKEGSFTYTPVADFNGTDSFTYRAYDDSLSSDLATVTLTVTPVNDAPVADNDIYIVIEDQTLTVDAAGGVLNGDYDIDGDPLSAVLISGPAAGQLTLNADGSFTYIPDADYPGSDSFSYQAYDGTVYSPTAVVTLEVTPTNDAPVAADDAYSVSEDQTLTVAAPGVLGNDGDVDGDPLTAVLVGSPLFGQLSLQADGSFTYTPVANYTGPDSFSYRANDGQLTSNTATVSLTVTAANDAPQAQDAAYTLQEDEHFMVAAPGVLSGAADPDGDLLSAVLVSDTTRGQLSLQADGSFTYIPQANYYGTDSFQFQVSDGQLTSPTATVSLAITPVNDAPLANADAWTVTEDQVLTISAPAVLSNDSDPEGDALTAVWVSGPEHGQLTLQPDGSFTYTPAADYFGSDSFSYRADDGQLTSPDAVVSLTITPVNDVPVVQAKTYSLLEGQNLVVSAPGVLSGALDVEGDPITAVLVSGPSHGQLVLQADGSFTYAPDAQFHGTDSFSFQGYDGLGYSQSALVSLGVNENPQKHIYLPIIKK